MFNLFWNRYSLEILFQGLILIIIISYIGYKSKLRWKVSKNQFIVITTFAMLFSLVSLFVILDVLNIIHYDLLASDGRYSPDSFESGTNEFIPYLVWQGIIFVVMFSFLGIAGYNSIGWTSQIDDSPK